MKIPMKLKKAHTSAQEAPKAPEASKDTPKQKQGLSRLGGLRKKGIAPERKAEVSIGGKKIEPTRTLDTGKKELIGGDYQAGEKSTQPADFDIDLGDYMNTLSARYPDVVVEFIERGLKICKLTGISVDYFEGRYLKKDGRELNKDFNEAYMNMLKRERDNNI